MNENPHKEGSTESVGCVKGGNGTYVELFEHLCESYRASILMLNYIKGAFIPSFERRWWKCIFNSLPDALTHYLIFTIQEDVESFIAKHSLVPDDLFNSFQVIEELCIFCYHYMSTHHSAILYVDTPP